MTRISDSFMVKDLFLLFLARNSALDSFFKNRDEALPLFGPFDFFSRTPPKQYIASAFPWYDAAEGKSYWHELSRKWVEICKFYNL